MLDEKLSNMQYDLFKNVKILFMFLVGFLVLVTVFLKVINK